MKLSTILRGSVPALSPSRPAESGTLGKAIKRVDETFPDIAPTQSEQGREAVACTFQRRIEAWNWDGCTVENAASAARAAFAPELRERDDLATLRRFVLAEAKVSDRCGLLKAMLDVHIDSYQHGAAWTRQFAAAMVGRRADLPVRSREVLATLPEALDAGKGGTMLGQRMAAAPDAATPFAKLPVIPSGGLVDTASASFVAALAPRVADQAVSRRILDWFAPDGGRARVIAAEAAIDALLSPWQRDEPPEAWKRILLDRLVAAYQDPRITPGGAWGRVREDTRETFIRWQTGATLRAFLDIVSLAEDSHMWGNRRPFWEGLYEQGHIQAAWVAFSRKAAAIAVRKANETGDKSLRNFGRQIAGGSRADTSILILRINGRTVVEGSHSYKVHVFPDNHQHTPRMFGSRYDCEEIRLALADTMENKRTHIGELWKIWVREKTGCPR